MTRKLILYVRNCRIKNQNYMLTLINRTAKVLIRWTSIRKIVTIVCIHGRRTCVQKQANPCNRYTHIYIYIDLKHLIIQGPLWNDFHSLL